MGAEHDRSTWFNVGAFLGHVGRAIVADTSPQTQPTARRTSVSESPVASPVPNTRAVLRRTTTDELIIEPIAPTDASARTPPHAAPTNEVPPRTPNARPNP